MSPLGTNGIPTAGVSAVQITLVAYNPTTSGTVQVRPTGAAAPGTTSLYYTSDLVGSQTNTTIVKLAADGTFQVRTDTSINLLMDVEGYFTAGDTAAGGFVPLSPATRVVDTRSGLGLPQARLSSGSTTTIDIASLAPDVPTNASAAFINFEIVNRASQAGHIVPFAAGTPRTAAGLSFPGMVTTSASATVALGTGANAGKIDVYLAGGPVDLLVNVIGFYTPVAEIGGEYSYSTFTPGTGRLLNGYQLPGNSTVEVAVANKFGMPDRAWGLDAVALNIQVRHRGTANGGHIGMWPDDEQNPGTTVLNYQPGTARSNFATVAVGSLGSITLANGGSETVTVYLDLQGWYALPAALVSAPSEIAENLDAMPDVVPLEPGVPTVDGTTAPLTSDGDITLPSATGESVGLPVPLGINDEEVVEAETTPEGAAVYADLDAAFEYIVQSVDTSGDADLASSTRNLITIHSPHAPDYYTFPLDLPEGASLELDAETGAVVAVDAGGNALGVFDAPWAIDADGNDLPTHYEIIGPDTFAQYVDHSGATAYPVVADPVWVVPVIVVGARAAVQVTIKAGSKAAAQRAARNQVAQSGRRPTGRYGTIKKYKSFTARNLRDNLAVRTGRKPANCQAHHIMPQKHRDWFERRNIDIDDPNWAVWWTSKNGQRNNHGSMAPAYNEFWRIYIREYPNATKQQILNYAAHANRQFSKYYRC